MIVKLKSKDPRYPDLSDGQEYFVLGIEADDYRILNDVGKPFLYAPELFDVVDPTEPEEWVTEFAEEGERYSYPAPLNEVGFFEDFFDQKPEKNLRLLARRQSKAYPRRMNAVALSVCSPGTPSRDLGAHTLTGPIDHAH